LHRSSASKPTEPATNAIVASVGTIKNIQALRAIAALSVVLYHIDIIGIGSSGVDIFFVISGFVIAKSGSNVDAVQFYSRRLFRIVPIYWIGTILVFGIAIVAPHLLKHTDADLADLIRSLIFIPYLKSSGLAQPVLFLGWTLNYEMFFIRSTRYRFGSFRHTGHWQLP
jgi:peptidoglycan/LPS O-acetylase OafA/YrhL